MAGPALLDGAGVEFCLLTEEGGVEALAREVVARAGGSQVAIWVEILIDRIGRDDLVSAALAHVDCVEQEEELIAAADQGGVAVLGGEWQAQTDRAVAQGFAEGFVAIRRLFLPKLEPGASGACR